MENEQQSPAPAIKLLSYWTGLDYGTTTKDGSSLAEWQTWYAEKFPDQPEAKLPVFEQSSPWNLDTLTEYFASSDGRKGIRENGRVAYEKAQCANCHRVGSVGTTIGPDLTTVASRFTRKEVIESILFPSHIISDQYKTQRVLTTDGKVFSGVVTKNANGTVIVRDSQLTEHVVAEQDIDQIEPSKSSLMPSGLLDNLSAAEIRDMMTYLGFVPAQQTAEREEKPVLR
jgi:putative heme-binding domain-containing protein